MARTEEIRIDLDSLSDQDWADARAIAAEGGADLPSANLADIAANPAPVPILTALLYVTMRKEAPGITARRCVRIACDALGVPRGG